MMLYMFRIPSARTVTCKTLCKLSTFCKTGSYIVSSNIFIYLLFWALKKNRHFTMIFTSLNTPPRFFFRDEFPKKFSKKNFKKNFQIFFGKSPRGKNFFCPEAYSKIFFFREAFPKKILKKNFQKNFSKIFLEKVPGKIYFFPDFSGFFCFFRDEFPKNF